MTNPHSSLGPAVTSPVPVQIQFDVITPECCLVTSPPQHNNGDFS